MTLTPLRTLAAGALLILLANAVALTGVYLNRSGEPESRLVLSQRELSVPWDWRGSKENSGLALGLNWRVGTAESSGDYYGGYSFSGGTPDWLDEARMAALGFDTKGWALDNGTRRRFERSLPRDVLLVLELAGPSWQQALARARENAARHEGGAAGQRGQQGIHRQGQVRPGTTGARGGPRQPVVRHRRRAGPRRPAREVPGP
jgi:hypothetical protein